MQKFNSKDLKPIIEATFPKYRKRTVYVQSSDKGRITDVNWSGGTRKEYRACTIDGRPLETTVNMSGPAPWNNPFEGLEINIPPGMVLVEGGHFCGKVATLFITVNPADVKLLPANS